MTGSRSSSPRARSRSREPMDSTEIPLPSSEAGSVRENTSMNIPESASLPPVLTMDEFWKEIQAMDFLREVAERDPYIPNPRPMPREPTEHVDEEKKPTRTESWERVLKEVSRHDEDMVKGWRDDIDTLLVFAGLFSAVVTAFVIESYQWLGEDPADTTVTLLTYLISVQVSGSQGTPFEPSQFKPDASSIRINVFWFLSLILSLTSALFGLLCKQWVREHQRDTTTRTPGEALALRQLRRDSFEKWGVSSFLSALPILLEVALLLFFVGVLDVLWNRHPVPFAICSIAISFSAGLYFLTTVLPTLMVPRDQRSDIEYEQFDRLSYQFICPYKSPQAWLVYRLSSAFIHLLLKIPAVDNLLRENARRFWDHSKSLASGWSSFDLWVVRQFDQRVKPPFDPFDKISFVLKVYELRAFEWAVAMFRDSPSMIPHLQNVLETIPPSVAMSAVLGRWDCTMGKAISMEDVELTLKFPDPDSSLDSTVQYPVLQQPEGINLLFHHQYWRKVAAHPFRDYVLNLIDSLKRTDLQHFSGFRFVIPFSVVDALWTHEQPDVRAKSLTLLSLLEQSWKPCPGYDEGRHNSEREVFMEALADHINRKDCVSTLLTSKRGQTFIRFIHNDVIMRRPVYRPFFDGFRHIWSQAIERAQEVGNLPSDYFAPIPRILEPLPTLPNLDPIRYSIDTERDDNEVLDIIASNGTEDSSRAGPSEGGHIHRLRNFGARLTARLRLSFFSRSRPVTRNDVYLADSLDEMSNITSRESRGGHGNIAQRLGSHNSTRDSGPRQRTDTGIPGDSSGQAGSVDGNSYGLRSQRSRVDAMGQLRHDQEDFDVVNVQRLGIDTGALGDPIAQDDEVEVHGDSYSLHSIGRRVSDSHSGSEHAE